MKVGLVQQKFYGSRDSTIVATLKYIQKVNISQQTSSDLYYLGLAKLAADNIEDEDMRELRNYPPEVVFNKLADNGIILSVEDFYKYAFGINYGDIAEHMGQCVAYTRDNIFSEIQDNNNSVKVANDTQFDKECNSYTFIPSKLMSKLAFNYSITDNVAAKVLANTACGKTTKLVLIKSSEDENPTARYLAYKYASYKAAMVDRILATKHNINKQDVMALAVTQNLFN